MGASALIDQDFANTAANLKRTVAAVNAVCCPDLTRKFPELGLLFLFEERADAEDSEVIERAGGLHTERRNRRRRNSRIGSTHSIRGEGTHHCRGPKESNSGRSRRHQLSRTLRSGRHPTAELRRICPRVDHERTPRKLAQFWHMSVEGRSPLSTFRPAPQTFSSVQRRKPPEFQVSNRGNCGRWIAR